MNLRRERGIINDKMSDISLNSKLEMSIDNFLNNLKKECDTVQCCDCSIGDSADLCIFNFNYTSDFDTDIHAVGRLFLISFLKKAGIYES